MAGPPAEAEAGVVLAVVARPGHHRGQTKLRRLRLQAQGLTAGVSHGFLVSTSVLHTLRSHVKTQQQRAEPSFSHDLSQSHKPEALSVKHTGENSALPRVLQHKTNSNVSRSSRDPPTLKQAKTCTVTSRVPDIPTTQALQKAFPLKAVLLSLLVPNMAKQTSRHTEILTEDREKKLCLFFQTGCPQFFVFSFWLRVAIPWIQHHLTNFQNF